MVVSTYGVVWESVLPSDTANFLIPPQKELYPFQEQLFLFKCGSFPILTVQPKL